MIALAVVLVIGAILTLAAIARAGKVVEDKPIAGGPTRLSTASGAPATTARAVLDTAPAASAVARSSSASTTVDRAPQVRAVQPLTSHARTSTNNSAAAQRRSGFRIGAADNRVSSPTEPTRSSDPEARIRPDSAASGTAPPVL